jgi:hypothetical protein
MVVGFVGRFAVTVVGRSAVGFAAADGGLLSLQPKANPQSIPNRANFIGRSLLIIVRSLLKSQNDESLSKCHAANAERHFQIKKTAESAPSLRNFLSGSTAGLGRSQTIADSPEPLCVPQFGNEIVRPKNAYGADAAVISEGATRLSKLPLSHWI